MMRERRNLFRDEGPSRLRLTAEVLAVLAVAMTALFVWGGDLLAMLITKGVVG